MLSKDFYSWVKPLLEEHEYRILTSYIRDGKGIIQITHRTKVMKTYKLTRKQFYFLKWKLNFLVRLFESSVR